MPKPFRSDNGPRAVALLATAFVVLVGAVVTAFMVLAFAERSNWQHWVVWGGVFFGVVLLLKSLLGRSSGAQWELWTIWRRSKEDQELAQYRPRYRSPAQGPTASNQPPTVESIRQIAAENVRWVPTGQPQDRPRPKRHT